jgi:hypothetical protein
LNARSATSVDPPVPAMPPGQITARQWAMAGVLGFLAYFLVSIVLGIFIPSNLVVVVGFVTGSYVAGRFVGAKTRSQWAMAVGVTLLGVMAYVVVLVILLHLPPTPSQS